jgi:hypothetical protein
LKTLQKNIINNLIEDITKEDYKNVIIKNKLDSGIKRPNIIDSINIEINPTLDNNKEIKMSKINKMVTIIGLKIFSHVHYEKISLQVRME